MFDLSMIYKPMTAHPLRHSAAHDEYPPCDALKPYIACFWGSQNSASPMPDECPTLVIPDTCMDIIFAIDPSTDAVSGSFHLLCDQPFWVGGGEPVPVDTFAIRFHFWAVHLFAGEDLRGSLNDVGDVDAYFDNWQAGLAPCLLGAPTMAGRIEAAERFLLTRLDAARRNDSVMNAIYHILHTKGTGPVGDACGYAGAGQRQLERLFQRHVGISVKKASTLVRYQNVWRDVMYKRIFDVQDAVEQYGYADQPHLLNEFARFHGVTPNQAKKLALGLK